MKIKNFKMDGRKVIGVVTAGLIISMSGGFAIAFFNYNDQHQVTEDKINKNEAFVNENGEYYHTFDAGEHIIKISRNDPYYRKIENVDGYEIQDVELYPWRFNNNVTYVNSEPVTAIATQEKDDELQFDDFGTVVPINSNNLEDSKTNTK